MQQLIEAEGINNNFIVIPIYNDEGVTFEEIMEEVFKYFLLRK